MKQFFTTIWDVLHQIGEARYRARSRSGNWDY
jgi:hypothetical protein